MYSAHNPIANIRHSLSLLDKIKIAKGAIYNTPNTIQEPNFKPNTIATIAI